MDWNQVAGEWKQLVERVRQKWGRLTDDDMEQIDGRREKLISRVQQRYGYTKTAAETEIDDFCSHI